MADLKSITGGKPDYEKRTYLICTVGGMVQSITTDKPLMVTDEGDLILSNDTEEVIISRDHMVFIRSVEGDLDDFTHDNFRHPDQTKH